MENNQVQEDPGPIKSDLIIITPGECIKLGLFKDIQNKGMDLQSYKIADAPIVSLKKEINKLESSISIEQKHESKLNSKIKQISPIKDSLHSRKLSNWLGAKTSYNEDTDIIANKKKLPLCGQKKSSTVTSQALDSDMTIQNLIKNKTEPPTVLNSVISKCPVDTRKCKLVVAKVTSNNKQSKFLNTSVKIKNDSIGQTRNLLAKKKSKIIDSKNIITSNANLILNEVSHSPFKSRSIEKADGLVYSESKLNTSVIKEHKHNVSKLNVDKETLKKDCILETVQNLQTQNNDVEVTDSHKLIENCHQAVPTEVVKEEISIVSITPVYFSNEGLKNLTCNGKSKSQNSLESKGKEEETASALKTDTDQKILSESLFCLSNKDSQLELLQDKHIEDVAVIKEISDKDVKTLEKDQMLNTINREQSKHSQLSEIQGKTKNGSKKIVTSRERNSNEKILFTSVTASGTTGNKNEQNRKRLEETQSTSSIESEEKTESAVKIVQHTNNKLIAAGSKEDGKNTDDKTNKKCDVGLVAKRKTKSFILDERTSMTTKIKHLKRNNIKFSKTIREHEKYSLKGSKEKTRTTSTKNKIHNEVKQKIKKQKSSVKYYPQKQDINNEVKVEKNEKKQAVVMDHRTSSLKKIETLDIVYGPENLKQEWKEDVAEEKKSEEKIITKNKATQLLRPSEHLQPTEEDTVLQDNFYKKGHTYLSEEEKNTNAVKDGQARLEHKSEQLHKSLPETICDLQKSSSCEKMSSTLGLILKRDYNLKEEKIHIAVPADTELENQPTKFEANENQQKEKHLSSLPTTTKKHLRKSRIVIQEESVVKDNCEEGKASLKTELVYTPLRSFMEKSIVKESETVASNSSNVVVKQAGTKHSKGIRTEEHGIGEEEADNIKFNTKETICLTSLMLVPKQTFAMGVKQNEENASIKSSPQQFTAEENGSIKAENTKFKAEENLHSLQLISVPKKRVRKFKRSSETSINQDDIKQDEQSNRAEIGNVIDTENKDAKTEECHDSTKLTSVPKKRGRKRKNIFTTSVNHEGDIKHTEQLINAEMDNIRTRNIGNINFDSPREALIPKEHEISTAADGYQSNIKSESIVKAENVKLTLIPTKYEIKRKMELVSNSISEDHKLQETNEVNTEESVSTNCKYLDEEIEAPKLEKVGLKNPRGNLKITETLQEEINPSSFQKSSKNSLIDAETSEDAVPNMNSDVKLQKKKSKPRKNAKIQGSNIPSSAPLLKVEEMITSTPLPKRGRKRKSELSSPSNGTADTIQTTTEASSLDESISKRKRKKINYFELENNIILEDFGIKERRRRVSKERTTLELKSKKLKTCSQDEKNAADDFNMKKEKQDDLSKCMYITEVIHKKLKTYSKSNKNISNDSGISEVNPKKLKPYIRNVSDDFGVTQGIQKDLINIVGISEENPKKLKTKKSTRNIKKDNQKHLPKDEGISEVSSEKVNAYSQDGINTSLPGISKTESNSPSKICNSDVQVDSNIIKTSDSKEDEEDGMCDNENQEASIERENAETSTHANNKMEKKSKYKRTGETVLMMQSIFTAALKNTSTNKSEFEENTVTGNDSSEPDPSNAGYIKRRRGRMKRSQLDTQIIVDEDNMVTCTSCNKKMDNEEWDTHNRKVHYNLSWRVGEEALNLEDGAFISRTLRPILRQDKTLKCSKCATENSSVGEFISHMEQCSGIVTAGGLVTCAVCKQTMEKSKWNFHKQRQHNNLAWRTGDRPLDLNDQNLVLSILNALYKAKKPLHCEKCNAQKKSVVGYLSHKAQCGSEVDAKVQCKFCNRKVLPVSMQSHVKLAHEKKEDVDETSDLMDDELNTSSSKRKAARMAMAIIDKFAREKIVQEHSQHYVAQLNFSEGGVTKILKKELAENQMIKCKFKSCDFVTDGVKLLLDHMELCERKPDQYYTCNRCLVTCDSDGDIKEHVKSVHGINIIEHDFKADYDEDESEDDGEKKMYDKEMKRRTFLEKKKLEKDFNYRVKPACTFVYKKKPKHLFSHALYYTLEFCHQHFSKHSLFDHLRYLTKDWTLLDEDLIEDYLPKAGQSCAVARRVFSGTENVLESEYTFKKFELFETECDEGIATIFCGGPIHSIAWLPTPHTSTDCNQILAVAAGNDFEEKYVTNMNYSEPSLIQFWNFGVLQNKHKIPEPKLMFCLAFDFGPVWHMEWCPSGCYDDKEISQYVENTTRKGLLAVAGSDSLVYIYSIPFLKEDQMNLIYKVEPLLNLCLTYNGGGSLGNEKFYATKVSWSMSVGHRYVAVGYTDGMVGLFDLDSSSELLKHKDVLLPYKSFQAHTSYVSAIHWIHLGGGNRWLFTSSFDKGICLWDLSNDSKFSYKKYIISDGVWLTNWIAYITTADETSTNTSPVYGSIKAYRDYMYEHVHLTSSPTTLLCLSSSNWLNSIIFCSSVGVTIAAFPNQLLYSLDSERKLKLCKYLFGYAKLIDKQKTPAERVAEEIKKQQAVRPIDLRKKNDAEISRNLSNTVNPAYNEPFTYKEAEEKYGLLFCDRKMDKLGELPRNVVDPCLNTDKQEYAKPNLYSLQAINKVAYNPNRQASLYYAAGYQAGFVRLTYIKFLEKDPQVV